MRPVLLVEPIGGIAGDMFLAAAIDLGVRGEDLTRALSGLKVPGWRFEISRAIRHQVSGTHLDVVIDEHEHHPHRSLADIRALIEACETFPGRAKQRALEVFRLIGEAEAKIHDVPIEKIHFHEVGAVDSIVDICGAAVALELLGDPEVFCTPPPLGSGTIKVAHGNMPVPAPATLELLRDVPVRFEGRGELTTPTGAALVKAFARFEAVPPLKITRVGYGVGTKDFADRPNVVRVSLGARYSPSLPHPDPLPEGEGDVGSSAPASPVASTFVIEANLDDCSPQLLGALIEKLLSIGALDAYVLPAVMKKSRPGHLLGAVVEAAQRDAVISMILRETTTIGLRSYAVERTVLSRRFEEVDTPYGTVRLKLAERDGELLNAFPEFEDCRARAEEHHVPVKLVQAEAIAAFHRKRSTSTP